MHAKNHAKNTQTCKENKRINKQHIYVNRAVVHHSNVPNDNIFNKAKYNPKNKSKSIILSRKSWDKQNIKLL